MLYRTGSRDDTRAKATRLGLWSSFVVYMLFSVTDILLVPDVAPYTIAARFACRRGDAARSSRYSFAGTPDRMARPAPARRPSSRPIRLARPDV